MKQPVYCLSYCPK